MNIKYIIVIFFLIFLFQNSIAQDYKSECEIYNAYKKNLKDSILVNGFYEVSQEFPSPEDFNYQVKYNQNVKEIEVEKNILFFKRKIKTR
jgi:hypothetical protein